MLIEHVITCKAKQTPAQARAACGTVCSAELTISLTERTPCMTSPTACLTLSSPSVFFRPAWTSRSICDHLLVVFACSIEFSTCDLSGLELSSLSSRDKILSYASSNFGSLRLISSYALFQSCSDGVEEGEDGVLEGACSKTGAVGACKAVAGERTAGSRVAGC